MFQATLKLTAVEPGLSYDTAREPVDDFDLHASIGRGALRRDSRTELLSPVTGILRFGPSPNLTSAFDEALEAVQGGLFVGDIATAQRTSRLSNDRHTGQD